MFLYCIFDQATFTFQISPFVLLVSMCYVIGFSCSDSKCKFLKLRCFKVLPMFIVLLLSMLLNDYFCIGYAKIGLSFSVYISVSIMMFNADYILHKLAWSVSISARNSVHRYKCKCNNPLFIWLDTRKSNNYLTKLTYRQKQKIQQNKTKWMMSGFKWTVLLTTSMNSKSNEKKTKQKQKRDTVLSLYYQENWFFSSWYSHIHVVKLAIGGMLVNLVKFSIQSTLWLLLTTFVVFLEWILCTCTWNVDCVLWMVLQMFEKKELPTLALHMVYTTCFRRIGVAHLFIKITKMKFLTESSGLKMLISMKL